MTGKQQTESALALAKAYREPHAKLLGWLRHRVGDQATAEDLPQDVFSKALAASDKGGLPDNPGAWLRTIARNTIIDFYRTKRPATALPDGSRGQMWMILCSLRASCHSACCH